MAKTFTVGFGAKADVGLDEDYDPMDDEGESHNDPYGEEEELSDNDDIQEVDEDEEVPIAN